jgi:putative RecB family exonuclease
MPAPLYPCTPTRLTTWLDCPRRYRFSYLDRPQPPKGPPWAHNSIGASVHSALADWWGLPLSRRTPDEGRRLVRKRWLHEGFRDSAQSGQAAERAVGWVGDYLSGVDPTVEPVGVERTVSTPTRPVPLVPAVPLSPANQTGPPMSVPFRPRLPTRPTRRA